MNRTPLSELVRVLHTLGDYGNRLDPAAATPEQLLIVTRAIDEARRLLAAAQGPANQCPRHPGAPTDPTDGDRCIFCRTRRYGAATVTDATTTDVLATVADHGEEAAARRYGPRALTLALAAAGRGTHHYPPNQRPNGRTSEESNA
ncbi:hypothetical protein [Streptomyces sp. NPDC007346]|uniref:hypothetical protein n=1 Tax=Streptomyces sp. NPDC007346 TaxID=3154682 RepID=UPI003451AE99